MVLLDFQGDLSQTEMREICETHFSGQHFIHTDWRDIYKKGDAFYCFFSVKIGQGKRCRVVSKYNFDEKTQNITIEIFKKEDILEQFLDVSNGEIQFNPEEKNKAERVFKDLYQIVMDNITASATIYQESLSLSRFSEKEVIDEYWKALELINDKNLIFNPEYFAIEFEKYYPIVNSESIRALQYIVKEFGQEKYEEFFEKAFIWRKENGVAIFPNKNHFAEDLSKVKFIPELSKNAITEKSLAIMEIFK